MQPDSSLTNAFLLHASSLRVNSPLDQRKAVGLIWETGCFSREMRSERTVQLQQRSLIVCAKLIPPKILTSFLSSFPKATLRL